jgi:hypothetical protein
MCSWYNDSYSYNSDRTYYKDRKCRAETVCELFLPSPDLFDELHTETINSCRIVIPNQKRNAMGFWKETDVTLTAIVWKAKGMQTSWHICIIFQHKAILMVSMEML